MFRRVAISGVTFDERHVIDHCRKFLAKNGDKKLIVVTFVPDLPKAIGSFPVGCDHCNPYSFWMSRYSAVAKEKFPIGELMGLDGNAVLRYRDEQGVVSETVIVGTDPRPVVLYAFKGRIVHVGMSGRMPLPFLEVYVVGSGEMSSATGADYIAKFNRRMGLKNSIVEFRFDPWFINQISTIWFPLFEEHRGEPPSEQVFNATTTQSCKYWSISLMNESSWKGVTRVHAAATPQCSKCDP